MHIKKFEEYVKINELYVHKKKKEELDGKYFILFQKNLWIFNEEEWEKKKYYNPLNKAYGKKIASADIHDTLQSIREQHFDVLTGQIHDGVIYINMSGSDYRHSEHSADLYKLKTELDMPVKIQFNSGKYMEKEEELKLNVDKKELLERRFYHGTSLNFLPQILQKGLMPTGHTNYNGINHNNKIFFTLNLETAQFHSFNAAQQNQSFPIIVEIKIPDVSKLIVDYDLARDVYGDKSKIMKDLDYKKFQKGSERDGMDYKKDITNKIGIYGYVGRIPVTYVQDIWIDLYTYSNYQDVFNPELGEYDTESDAWGEFSDVSDWSELSKNEVMKRVLEIQENFEEENSGYDEDEEYSEDDEDNN